MPAARHAVGRLGIAARGAVLTLAILGALGGGAARAAAQASGIPVQAAPDVPREPADRRVSGPDPDSVPDPNPETDPDPGSATGTDPVPGSGAAETDPGDGADPETIPDVGPDGEAATEVDPDLATDGPADPDGGEDVVGSLGAAIGELGESLGAGAEPHGRIRWDPRWPRYRFDELVVTLGMGLVIVLEEALPTRTDPNWQAVTDLDLEVADALGLRSAEARDAVEEISDGLAAALFVWPVALDSLLYAGLGEGAWDVAWQLSLISLETIAINHALTVLVRLLTRRERPLGRFCREEAGYDADPVCEQQPPAESFWGAHVSNAFAGAALVCMHHDVLDLFGDEVADGMACGTALAAAATTGMFRIMSDHHWVTDVMTGAVVGSLSGILIPWLLHFQGGARPPLEGTDLPPMAFFPMMGQGTIGVSGMGLF